MSDRVIFRAARLPKETLLVDAPTEKKVFQLKCSRRKLAQLLGAVAGTAEPRPS
jgi:hypothetical protein